MHCTYMAVLHVSTFSASEHALIGQPVCGCLQLDMENPTLSCLRFAVRQVQVSDFSVNASAISGKSRTLCVGRSEYDCQITSGQLVLASSKVDLDHGVASPGIKKFHLQGSHGNGLSCPCHSCK